MAFIEWKNDFTVSVAEIDDQHRHLVAMINRLHEGMKARQGQAVLKETLAELADYAISHFGTEEKYFTAFGYPSAPIHKVEHDRFVAEVAKFKKGFDSGQVMLSMEVMDFLKNWLISHIQVSDKKYSAFFNEKGLH
jgi:hemerythrin-like metal-binding protein